MGKRVIVRTTEVQRKDVHTLNKEYPLFGKKAAESFLSHSKSKTDFGRSSFGIRETLQSC